MESSLLRNLQKCHCGADNDLYRKPGDQGLCAACRTKQQAGEPIRKLLDRIPERLEAIQQTTFDDPQRVLQLQTAVTDLVVINRMLLELLLQRT